MLRIVNEKGDYITSLSPEADALQAFGLYYTSYPNGNVGWEYNHIPPKEFWEKLELISPGNPHVPSSYKLKENWDYFVIQTIGGTV